MKSKCFNILAIAIFLPLTWTMTAQAAETAAKKKKEVNWERVDLKCHKLSPEKALKYKKFCQKARHEVSQKQKQEKYPFIALRVFSDYSITNYEVKDTTSGAHATLSSKSNMKFTVNLVEHYSKGFKSYVGLSYQNIDFDQPTSKHINNPNLDLWGFHGGLVFNPFNRLSLDLGGAYRDFYYIRGYGPDELKFSKHLVPEIYLNGQLDLFSAGSLDFGLGGHVAYAFPFDAKQREEPEGNFHVEGNLSYGGSIIARKQFESWSLSGEIGMNRQNLKTSVTDGYVDDVTFGLKIAVPFGWNEGK